MKKIENVYLNNTPQEQQVVYNTFLLNEGTIKFLESRTFEYKGYYVNSIPSYPMRIISGKYTILKIKNFLS